MSSSPEQLRAIAERLWETYSVRLDVEELVSRPDGDVARFLTDAKSVLKARQQSLKDARTELKHFVDRIDDVQAILPFTAEGWPERRSCLQAKLAEDPAAGVADWLGDWFAAAATMRLAALGRLLGDDLTLPPSARLLHDRAAAAVAGLKQSNWDVASDMLAAGEGGPGFAGWWPALPADVQQRLVLLRIRLAVDTRHFDEARAALGAAEASGASPALAALRFRLARAAGTPPSEDDAPASSDLAGPTDLDVAAELVARARETSGPDGALDVARTWVAALRSVVDADNAVQALLGAASGELWIALAERAVEERDTEVATRALDEAGRIVASDAFGLRAAIGELRSRALHSRAERVEELLGAGDSRIWADQYEQARVDYEAALAIDPSSPGAKLGLGEALRLSCFGKPLSIREPILLRAAALLDDVMSQGPVDGTLDWCYACAARIHLDLASRPDLEGRKSAWTALWLAARAVVRPSATYQMWSILADAASELGLYLLAVEAAQRIAAVADDANRQDAQSQYVRTLANAGRYQIVLDHLSGDDPWSRALRAHCLVFVGRSEEALRLLEETPIESDWPWARQSLVVASAFAGRRDEATKEAEALLADLAPRLDELNYLRAAAFAAALCGLAVEAGAWSQRLLEGGDSELFGVWGVRAVSRMLEGDTDGCAEALRSLAAAIADPSSTGTWWHLGRPLLTVLSQWTGRQLPDLTAVDALVEQSGHEVASLTAADQLARVKPVPGLEYEVERARQLLLPIAQALVGGAAAGRGAYERLAREDLPDDLDALDRWLDSLDASAQTPPAPAAAEATPAAPATTQIQELRLELPPSWFSSSSDPVREHPLFLRLFPELRARAASEIPGVQVTTDEALEPDGYRISVDGRADAGHVPRGWRYCPAGEGAAFLPAELREAAMAADLPGLLRIPEPLVESAGPFAALLTMTPEEVVVRILGQAIAEPAPERASP